MLSLRPCTIKAAMRYVREHHRHLPCVTGGDTRGVAIVARPARMFQDGYTAEIKRVATDGAFNACSMLYGACRRAARALGYRRLYTYLLAHEHATSVKAAGFTFDGWTDGGEWSRKRRPRKAAANSEPKQRWRAAMIVTTLYPDCHTRVDNCPLCRDLAATYPKEPVE